MRMRKLRRGDVGPSNALPKRDFGPLLIADKSDGGRGRSDYNMAAERARAGTEGERTGCVRYSSTGLALPCRTEK